MSPHADPRVSFARLARALIFGALGALPFADSEPRAGTLPAGFAENVAVSGLNMPMTFDFTPDGAIIFGEKEGAVKIWRDGALHLAAQLETVSLDESGINGMAVDPDYLTNHHLWIFRTMENTLHQRLSRFTVTGNVITDELVVMEFFSASTIHHAGCIRFDQQKRLYVSTGDDDRASTAPQNRFDPHGKMLRINRDGSVPPDNPFFDGIGGDPRVYAWGFRHPYRFSFEPVTDNLFIGDIGAGGWEELNLGVPGGNYGWGQVEGFTPPGVPGMIYPVFAYTHFSELGNSIIGGEHARPGDLSPEYEGHYFYGDEAAQQLRHLLLGPSQE
ncbi:MAG TPA: PQQ-dependent sugar dehydrogenase, partial [Candidatus Polarisedimenticolia bacterium]|nr:PQQ-dependent sugar dehydrogenase [Candidatus Polarisedimenticolia bacterium]